MKNLIKTLLTFIFLLAILCACSKKEVLDEQKDYALIKAMESARNQSDKDIDVGALEKHALIYEKSNEKGKYCLANALIGYKLFFTEDYDKSMVHLKKAEMNLMYCDSIASFVYGLIAKGLFITDTALALIYEQKALDIDLKQQKKRSIPYSYMNLSLLTKGDTAKFYLRKSLELFSLEKANMVKAQFAKYHFKELEPDTIIQYIQPYYNEVKHIGYARYLVEAYIQKNMPDSADLYIQHLASMDDFKNDYYICKAKGLVAMNQFEEACKWWNLAYNYNEDEWKFITNQRLGAINAEYDLLNAELQNEKRRVRMMGVYNVILVVLVALLSVAFVFLKRYKRDINERDMDIVKHKERFKTLFDKYKSDYNLDRATVMTEAMQNLEKLHEAYPSLTRTEVAIMWLLFMKCTTDTICELLNITHNYYYQRKTVIYRTLNIKSKEGSESAIEKIVREYLL